MKKMRVVSMIIFIMLLHAHEEENRVPLIIPPEVGCFITYKQYLEQADLKDTRSHQESYLAILSDFVNKRNKYLELTTEMVCGTAYDERADNHYQDPKGLILIKHNEQYSKVKNPEEIVTAILHRYNNSREPFTYLERSLLQLITSSNLFPELACKEDFNPIRALLAPKDRYK